MSLISPGTELRRFRRGTMPKVALVVLLFIPLIYGALYLWAFWAPNEHLDALPVALVNQDTGVRRADGSVLRAGDEVAANLLERKDVGWRTADEKAARSGVSDGKYYFALLIPPDFSRTVASVEGTAPKSAQLKVLYNDTNSFLASTLGKQAMIQVRDAVAQNASQQTAGAMLVGLDKLGDGLRSAASGAQRLAVGATSVSTGSSTLSSGLGDLASGATSLADGSSTLSTGLTDLASGAASLAAGAPQVAKGARQVSAGLTTASSGAQRLSSGMTTLSAGAVQVSGGLAALERGTAALPAQTRALASGASGVSSGTAAIARLAAAEPSMTLAQLDDALRAQGSSLAELASGASQVAAGAKTLSTGSTTVATSVARLQAGSAKVASGARTAASSSKTLAGGLVTLKTGAAQVAGGASEVASGASQLSAGARDAKAGARRVASGASQLSAGAKDASAGARRVASGASQLSSGSHTLATSMASGSAQVPGYTPAQISGVSAVVADPVDLDGTYEYQAQGFGEGFAPFFIALATFVGALITWLILHALPRRPLASNVSGLRSALTGLVPALLVGVGQVVIMVLVLVLGIGLTPEHLAGTVLFILLTTSAFLALQQMFIILLGTAAGRVVSLALLMLQLSSSGGTYPVETTPGFFRALHPFMPASYVVDGLRALITGGIDSRLWVAVAVMAGIFVVSTALSAWAAGRAKVWTIARLHPELTV